LKNSIRKDGKQKEKGIKKHGKRVFGSENFFLCLDKKEVIRTRMKSRTI